jgi:NitT/TauT family transport system substrate-binding protein
VLAVLPNSPYRSAKDLNGTTIGVISVGGIALLCVQGWIDRNGGDFGSLKMVEVTAAETVAALDQNRIAAGVLSDPQLSAERSRIRIIGKCYDAVAPKFMLTVWFSTTDWANKNPDPVRRFAEAMNAAEDWAERNPEQSRDVLEKWFKTKVVHMHHFHSRTIEPGMLQPVLDAAFKYKLVTKQLSAGDLIWTPGAK